MKKILSRREGQEMIHMTVILSTISLKIHMTVVQSTISLKILMMTLTMILKSKLLLLTMMNHSLEKRSQERPNLSLMMATLPVVMSQRRILINQRKNLRRIVVMTAQI